jgi:hypothetical protein
MAKTRASSRKSKLPARRQTTQAKKKQASAKEKPVAAATIAEQTKEEDDTCRETQIQGALHHLDQDYDGLEVKENQLHRALEKLKEDEACLRQAIQEGQGDSRTPMQKRIAKEAEVVQRLEQALLGISSNDDDSSDDSDD